MSPTHLLARFRRLTRPQALLLAAALLGFAALFWGLPNVEVTRHVPELSDLPLVEVPAEAPGARVAVLLSGDGGWAVIDRSIAQALARRGVAVVGWSSLYYYWQPRTADEAAHDLARIIDAYTRRLNRPRVLLVGYSFGADVLPFLVNRLPSAEREKVDGVALLGASPSATFEFDLVNWLGISTGPSYRVAPEVARMEGGPPVLCVNGRLEREKGCPLLAPLGAKVVMLAGGHHFDGRYHRLAQLILSTFP